MIVRPWVKGDTAKVDIQDAQFYMRGAAEIDADFSELSEKGLAWSFEHDGVVFGIAVVVPIWENRAMALMLFSRDAGKWFTRVHKVVVRFLESCGIRRVEATVDVDFPAGNRWIEMLGFEYEGLMKAYRPDGADMNLYARVR